MLSMNTSVMINQITKEHNIAPELNNGKVKKYLLRGLQLLWQVILVTFFLAKVAWKLVFGILGFLFGMVAFAFAAEEYDR